MKLLLTGFEPFDSQTINPSQLVVEHITQTAVSHIELVTAVLPVDRYEGPDTLIRTFIKAQPDAVICLGEASRNAAIAVEQVAINLLHFNIPDNKQNQPVDKPIQPEGAAAYFSTLPVRKMVENINAAHIPAKLSLSAGAHLCNQVMYTILHYLNRYQMKIPAGFIHLPQLPQQVVGKRPIPPSMSLETACQGVLVAINTLFPPADSES
ncbi:MAG: pyroglutamyl-peptidase I [Chloroflexi bacterium]|nr:pyroglutamyl-peptidase I [Chloroflexota bacterium]